jgi:hypothetical protein
LITTRYGTLWSGDQRTSRAVPRSQESIWRITCPRSLRSQESCLDTLLRMPVLKDARLRQGRRPLERQRRSTPGFVALASVPPPTIKATHRGRHSRRAVTFGLVTVTTCRSTAQLYWSATGSHRAAATLSWQQASLIDAQSHHPRALSMGCESLYAPSRRDACGPPPSTTAACQSSSACHPPTTGGRYRREAALHRGDQSQRVRRKSETVGCRRQYGRPTRRFSVRRPRRRTGPPTTTSNARMDNRAGPVASRWTTCASHGSADKRGADHGRSHWLAPTLTR